ncbi:putative exocyst complex component 6 [Triticum urartu]|uniref:Exocyst complex component n=1 Tax=Triticum urartu TaxID=4572 RepID=M7YH24_TRIUA|nr:putative exocyst complex component 6 [Triticum urartu]
MADQPKKRAIVDSGDGGLGMGLAAFIANGEDLGPMIRHGFDSGKPEALTHSLRSIVKKKEVEIEELCRLHYEDFILAVDELRGVMVDAEELKSMLSGENSHLQEASSALLLKLDKLLELYSVKKNVGEAMTILKICVKVITLCMACNNYIAEAKFHPALKTLDLIEHGYLQNIPVKIIKKVVGRQIPLIKLHIEKKACGEFNDWLVHIRRMSKQIGQVSISHASLACQKEEEMRARQREAEEHGHAGPDQHMYTLDAENTDEETALDFDLTPVYRTHHIHVRLGIGEKFRDYYYKNRQMQLSLDMQISTSQPFLESHQPFLAQVAGFFIVEQRVLRTAERLLTESQVEATWETAVAKMTSLLESQFSRIGTASHLLLIKDYITLMAGVLRKYGYQTTPLINILSRSRDKYHQLLLSECRRQVDDILANDSYEQMVIKKEYEYNMNVTAFHLEPILRKYGYQTTPLINILSRSRDKYHQLLLSECRRQVDDILANDSYEQMVIKKEYEYNMNVTAFHLEPSEVIPEFPYVAPFSSSVPEVCRVVRSFVEDSVSYLSYGGDMNLYEVVKAYLDRLLIEVLNDCLLNRMYARSLAMSQMMQLAGNISVLEHACDLYLLHCAQQCGIPKRVAERSRATLTARAVLKASQNAAYNALINMANSKIDDFMVLLDDVNWIVEETPDNANDYMNEVLIYLETLVSTASEILPLEALYKVVSGAVGHISDSIMTTLLSDGVKRLTMSAVLGLDMDLKMLEAFADEKFHITGLADMGKETTFRDCLVEIRQLVNLLSSSQPENFMNPVIRGKNYGSLDYKKVSIIVDKFKDSADGLFGSLSNRNTKQNARTRSLDVLKRRLKDFGH